MRRQGTTTVEIKSGYGLSVLDEARSLAVARQFTDETTFLGAHVVPTEYAEDPAGYVELVTGPMLEAAAPHARWVDVFCETGAFDADQARAVLAAGEAARAARPAARQPARAGSRRPARRRARPRRGRPLHLPGGRGRRGTARLRHHRDPAARRRVLDPPALPGRAAAPRRRRPGRAGQRLQPRVELHQLDAALHRPGGPRDGDDPRRGASTPRPMSVRGRWTGTTSASWPLARRADLTFLDAPGHVHLAYRPGVPLVAATWIGGRAVN